MNNKNRLSLPQNTLKRSSTIVPSSNNFQLTKSNDSSLCEDSKEDNNLSVSGKSIKQNSRVRNKNSYAQVYKDKLTYQNDVDKPLSRNTSNVSFSRKSVDESQSLEDKNSNIKRNKSVLDLNANIGKLAMTILKSKMNSTNNEGKKDLLQINSDTYDGNSLLDYSKIKDNFNEAELMDSAILSMNSPKESGKTVNINFDDLLQRQNNDLDDKNNTSNRNLSKNNSKNELNVSKNRKNSNSMLNNSLNSSQHATNKSSSSLNAGPKLKHSKTITDKDKFKQDVINKNKAPIKRNSTILPTTNKETITPAPKRNSISERNFGFGKILKDIINNRKDSIKSAKGENIMQDNISLNLDNNKEEISPDKNREAESGAEPQVETQVYYTNKSIELNDIIDHNDQEMVDIEETIITFEVENNLNYEDNLVNQNKKVNKNEVNQNKKIAGTHTYSNNEDEDDEKINNARTNKKQSGYTINVIQAKESKENIPENKSEALTDEEFESGNINEGTIQNRKVASKGFKSNSVDINNFETTQSDTEDQYDELSPVKIKRELSRIDEEEFINFTIEKFDILLNPNKKNSSNLTKTNENNINIRCKKPSPKFSEIKENNINIACVKKPKNNSIIKINSFDIFNKRVNRNEIGENKLNIQLNSIYPHRSQRVFQITENSKFKIEETKKQLTLVNTRSNSLQIVKIDKPKPEFTNKVTNIEIPGRVKPNNKCENATSFEIKKIPKGTPSPIKVSSFNIPSKIANKPEFVRENQKNNSFSVSKIKINPALEETKTISFDINMEAAKMKQEENTKKEEENSKKEEDEKMNANDYIIDPPNKIYIDSPTNQANKQKYKQTPEVDLSNADYPDENEENIELQQEPNPIINNHIIDEVAEFEEEFNKRISQVRSLNANNNFNNVSRFADRVNALKCKIDRDFDTYEDENIVVTDEDLLNFQQKYFGNDEFMDRELLIQFYKKYMNKQTAERLNNPQTKSNKDLMEQLRKNNLKLLEKEEIENRNNIKKIRDIIDHNEKNRNQPKYRLSNDYILPKNLDTSLNSMNISTRGSKILLGRSDNSCSIMPSNNILTSFNKNGNKNPLSVLDNYKFKK